MVVPVFTESSGQIVTWFKCSALNSHSTGGTGSIADVGRILDLINLDSYRFVTTILILKYINAGRLSC